jgi:phosphoribosyl 1,2-cyclic phosphate phosphodiesterase
MKVTFLGTGTSHGIPVIACDCNVCTSPDPRDNRLRSSIMLQKEGFAVVIDTGPDFREQMLREKVKQLDAVVFTHEHKDHTAGLDDIRAFNFSGKDMPVYAHPRVQDNLRRSFDYIFAHVQYPGIPKLELHAIDLEPFSIGPIDFIPVEVMHLKLPVLGFRIGDFAYITDANYISPHEIEKLRGVKTLVLNALRIQPHISHYSLEEAIEVAKEIGAQTTYFTHISHQLGRQADVEKTLPEGIKLSYDGMKLEV